MFTDGEAEKPSRLFNRMGCPGRGGNGADMKIGKVYAVYFSAVGNTRQVTEEIAKELGEILGCGRETIDFTLPADRAETHEFPENSLVVFGTPTYAGRIPNKVLPFVQTLFKGNGTPALAVVTFGNRNFDSSLTELKQELEKNDFRVFGAAAFACSHVFSDRIAPGRPDAADLGILREFAAKAGRCIEEAKAPADLASPVIRGGAPVAPYYTPLGMDGEPAKFLKAVPKTDPEICDNCGTCVRVCPMGSVGPDNVAEITGICIKCQACIVKCPTGAKYFDDPAFLSHVSMLEANYTRRAEPEIYI